MPRYIGIKNNSISIVSDKPFKSDENTRILEIPKEFEDLSVTELITQCKISNSGELKYKKAKKSAKDLKVAFVSNWAMACGIATYGKFLFSEIIPHVKDYQVFIEHQDSYQESLYSCPNIELSADKVIPCWKRGENLSDLIKSIKEYDPDVILINHEWGIFPNACHWLSLLFQLSNYRVIVIEHSVFTSHKDKTICEAAMPEIVVHLDGGKEILKNKHQVPGNVCVIPHGSFTYSKEKVWNLYRSEHTIIQLGFLLRYKNWEKALQAISLLKEKYPDIFFTGLCSESPFCKIEHQIYYNELNSLIESLKIQDNVALIRGYQSDQICDAYLRANKIALFPYTSNPLHEVFGASGAARLAMSKGLPVISSSMHHFSDLPTIKTDSSEQIAQEIDKLFSNSKLIEEQINKQNKFLEEHSWAKMALRYVNIFENP